jgi:hypothetical protein
MFLLKPPDNTFPVRKSLENDPQMGVPYTDRYNSGILGVIEKCGSGHATYVVYIGKKMYLVEVFWLGNRPVFVGWVNETPPDSPVLKFIFSNNVLKAQILYPQWWRYNRTSTVFRLVEKENIEKPDVNPDIATLAEEPY